MATIEDVFRFAHTRAAFVTQKKLYEYVKTRMGTSYPRHFADDDFIASMNVAKMHVYAAGLADMTMFAIANATANEAFTDADRSALARRCFAAGLDENDDGDVVPANRAQWCEGLEKRMTGAAWRQTGANENHFQASPKALVAWAPIADELKRYDTDIVENSIRFAWQAVRSEFFECIDAGAVARSWQVARADASG